MFAEHYTLMSNVCSTLSIAFKGNEVLAELWGASAMPTLLGKEPNQYQVMLLIRLSPYGLYQLTNFHQAEFTDKPISLKDADKELSVLLCQAFETASNIPELFSMCDRILYRRMESNVVSDALFAAANTILDRHGHIAVSEVASKVGYSDRQLNRLFLMQIGMKVKNFARITRFNYVLKHIQQSLCFPLNLSVSIIVRSELMKRYAVLLNGKLLFGIGICTLIFKENANELGTMDRMLQSQRWLYLLLFLWTLCETKRSM